MMCVDCEKEAIRQCDDCGTVYCTDCAAAHSHGPILFEYFFNWCRYNAVAVLVLALCVTGVEVPLGFGDAVARFPDVDGFSETVLRGFIVFFLIPTPLISFVIGLRKKIW